MLHTSAQSPATPTSRQSELKHAIYARLAVYKASCGCLGRVKPVSRSAPHTLDKDSAAWTKTPPLQGKVMAFTKDTRVQLSDGHTMPVLGLGTYAPKTVPKSVGEEATKVAIELGYRHIDCAYIYGNEVEIGRAIRAKISEGTVKREDIFYTGKLWCRFFSSDMVRKAMEKSMSDLQLDYLDLFIMHFPVSIKYTVHDGSISQTPHINLPLESGPLQVLEACKDAGLVRSIGVSNFNRRQLERLLNKPGLKYAPVCNQVECHPYLNQKKLTEFCKSKNIVVVGYSVLGSHRDPNWMDLSTPVLLEDPILISIGKKYNQSAAVVAMRYVLQLGVVVLAKSFSPERLKQNLQEVDPEKAEKRLEKDQIYYVFSPG
ncbi:hypothetical protein NDU88_006716 [Pleurodeles waltl]|uniref:NADP-dependent oxidoreductase domain-containing protein n=1 Tax=Pleurodeles waltl TaxID=8319 RepID=A0AAV7SQG1_PLEWA|nr:hypothetical protein NDU88_006716 [Pleurodeles waltl]